MSTYEKMRMREAAAYLGHSYGWLYLNHRILGLNGYQIGKRWFFDRQDLDLYVRKTKESYGWTPRLNPSGQGGKGRVSL